MFSTFIMNMFVFLTRIYASKHDVEETEAMIAKTDITASEEAATSEVSITQEESELLITKESEESADNEQKELVKEILREDKDLPNPPVEITEEEKKNEGKEEKKDVTKEESACEKICPLERLKIAYCALNAFVSRNKAIVVETPLVLYDANGKVVFDSSKPIEFKDMFSKIHKVLLEHSPLKEFLTEDFLCTMKVILTIQTEQVEENTKM